MHSTLLMAFQLADPTAGDGVKVALVTGFFVLMAAAVTTWGATRKPSENAVLTLAQAAQANYVTAIDRAERAEVRLFDSDRENARLRELVRALGHDPDEDPDEVKAHG